MPSEDTPAQQKSFETVTDADVQHLLNIVLAGAGVVEGLTPRTQSGTPTLYGEYRIHHDKPFQKYAELSMVSPPRLYPAGKAGPVHGLGLQAGSRRGQQVSPGRNR